MTNTSRIRDAISRVVPGFEKIAEIDKTKEEFQIGGRTFHNPEFATASGRAQMHVLELPPLRGNDDELRMMTVRSEGQFNTVVYEEYDLYRGQDRRDIILIHPDDLNRLGFEHDQKVTIHGEAGRLDNYLVRGYADIRPGNALMYCPEANALVARTADPKSKTPAFKCSLVRLEAIA